MAERTELEITIGADGGVRIATHGLKGQACLAETRDLERALGSVRSREKTREFYQQGQKGQSQVRSR